MAAKLVETADYTHVARGLIRDGVKEAVRKIAFDVEAKAKRNVRAHNRIDTGSMINSIHTDCEGHHGHAAAASQASASASKPGAHSGKPNKSFRMFPDEHAEPDSAIVVCGVEHGAVNEFGTVYTPAAPFMGPAATEVFADAGATVVSAIEKKLRK